MLTEGPKGLITHTEWFTMYITPDPGDQTYFSSLHRYLHTRAHTPTHTHTHAHNLM